MHKYIKPLEALRTKSKINIRLHQDSLLPQKVYHLGLLVGIRPDNLQNKTTDKNPAAKLDIGISYFYHQIMPFGIKLSSRSK